MTILKALDFLPDNLKPEESPDLELYPWVADLIDWALPVPTETESFPLDALIKQLGLEYDSDEAVSAYYNKFIKPIIGTRPAFDFAFQLAGTNPRVIEWFESATPIPAYKFVIEFDEYPGNTDINALLDLIFALKNERSWPTVVRMADCADSLVLDYGSLDKEPLSASEGFLTSAGVTVCLYQIRTQYILDDDTVIQQLFTGLYSQHVEMEIANRLDWTNWDDPFDEYGASIQAAIYSITDQLIEAELPPDPVAYRTATFQCQMVLSDYGELSGGEGFLGSVEDSIGYFLDQDELSETTTFQEVVLFVFEWVNHIPEQVDRTFTIADFDGFQTSMVTEYLAPYAVNPGEILYIHDFAPTNLYSAQITLDTLVSGPTLIHFTVDESLPEDSDYLLLTDEGDWLTDDDGTPLRY